MKSVNREYINRTKDNPIFLNDYAKNAIHAAAIRWLLELRRRGIDSGKDLNDLVGDMYVLWCESCIKHKDMPEKFINSNFIQDSEWALKVYIRNYFRNISGEGFIGGRTSFTPDFYEFKELYRNGLKIRELADHYGVAPNTIVIYIRKNFITKEPINPLEYLEVHEETHGRDRTYEAIKEEAAMRR